MNRNFKRVLAGLAALTLCVGVVPSSLPSMVSNTAIVASAAVDLTGYTQIPNSDAYYKIDGDTLYVDGLKENTEIPAQAFADINDDGYSGITTVPSGLTRLKIGTNITSIGYMAFAYWTELKTIDMPDVTSIEILSFYQCRSISEIKLGSTVPDGFIHIPKTAKILIPDSAYENYMSYEENGYKFYDYEGNVLEVVIPEGYTRIGDSMTIYKIVDDTLYVDGLEEDTHIPKDSFNPRKNVVLPETVKKVVISDKITSIYGYAFSECKSLQTVEMPNVTSIEILSFYQCRSISEIKLGSTVPDNFTNIPKTAKILIPEGSEADYSELAKAGYTFETYATIPEGYTQIGDSKTYYKNSEDDTTLYVDGIGSVPGNTSPYSKVFPNSAQKYIFGEDITSIGEYIFLGIWGAFEVEFLGDTVFEKNSFQSCRDGVSLVIPNVTSLNEAAFNDTPIISAKLGANPPQNFNKVFTNDTKILIPFDAYENYKSLEADGYKFYDYDGNVLTFEVPEGYTRVGNSKTCFKLDEEEKTMTVIGDVTIDFSVFSDENSEYVIPDYVKNIKVGNQIYTVYGPITKGREFDSVDLSSVQYIGSPLFEDTKIGTLDISGSSNLNPDFIINCDIDNVYFGKNVPNYMVPLASTHTFEGAKIYIPSDVYESDYEHYEEYGYNFYDYEGNPLTFQAPEGYTKIFNSTTYYKIVDDTLYIEGEGSITEHAFNAGFSNGFYKGIELPETVKKVVIADTVNKIGDLAFVYCPYIESVEIKGETVVGSAAFAGCKDLKSVKAEKVTVLNGSSFSSGSIETIKLGSIVPENFINSYAITSTKILIPESAYENYSIYQENGSVFADYDGNLLTSGIKNLISGVRFTLDGKIGVNIVTALLPDEITVTCDGKKLDIIRGDFCDTFYVAAKDMVKTYTIEAAGESFDINPEKILAIYNQPGYEYVRNEANALADYCKAASAYFDEDDSTKVAVIDDAIDLSEYVDKTPDDGNTYKTSLVLESETALKVYISNENGITAKEGQEQINANTVCVKFANIAAGSLDKSFDVNGGSFSAYGYIKKVIEQSDDEDLANLCKALYKYNEATK